MFARFSQLQNHLELAHELWQRQAQPGDLVIDATCGNGHDTLFLAKLVLQGNLGTVVAIDLQASGIAKTQELLSGQLTPNEMERVHFYLQSHETFPILPEKPKLIVYNLGYLPGSDKTVKTKSDTTLASLQQACSLLPPGGAVSITCYPGHSEGAQEENDLLVFCQTLEPTIWAVTHHRWLNRNRSPSIIYIQRPKKD